MSFLGWFDPDPKKPTTQKIAEAIARYRERRGHEPELVLVNPADLVEIDGLEVRAVRHVARNTFQVGRHDA